MIRLSKIGKLYGVTIGLVLLVSARNKASDEEFEVAHKRLARAYKAIGANMPSSQAPFQMNILASQIAIGRERGPEALEAACVALEQFSSGGQHMNPDDTRYMIAFCKALIHYCETWRDGVPPLVEDVLDLSEIEKVRPMLREQYPLPPGGAFV